MRKFRASMEPFWDLKISKYVEYQYFSLYKQRVTFSDKYCWPKLTHSFGLRNPRPKASLVLHNYSMQYSHDASIVVPCDDRSVVLKLYCTVELVEASKLVTIEAESWSHAYAPSHLCD